MVKKKSKQAFVLCVNYLIVQSCQKDKLCANEKDLNVIIDLLNKTVKNNYDYWTATNKFIEAEKWFGILFCETMYTCQVFFCK